MKRKRYSGVLLHPSSLPGAYGIGEIGPEAYRFADFLSSCGATLWQILPLGPTGYGNSPYSARSSFAGNEMLISIELLIEQGFLTAEEAESKGVSPQRHIDYELLQAWKLPLLQLAASRFQSVTGQRELARFEAFCKDQAYWLDDYVLFMVLNDHYGDSRWYSAWDRAIGFRDPDALKRCRLDHAQRIQTYKILQYIFFSQWAKLKEYVNALGIQLIGDIPIFVASDSVDAWSHPELFKTDAEGRFSAVSGVPPDYFSSTGQLWGTPVYDWQANEQEGFNWWLQRIEASLNLTDIVRIDHFRGLAAYWEVPAGASTAIEGTWRRAGGKGLLKALESRYSEVPLIAEDLGLITSDVRALKDEFDLPGMKVFQFAFDYRAPGQLDPSNSFLPHTYEYNCVAYTGTHDNDTTLGWYQSLPEEHRDLVRLYLARGDEDIVWSMIRALMVSNAKYVIVPMQDLLCEGSESRMNIPATAGGHNWSWRLTGDYAQAWIADRFRQMVQLYGRDGIESPDQDVEGYDPS